MFNSGQDPKAGEAQTARWSLRLQQEKLKVSLRSGEAQQNKTGSKKADVRAEEKQLTEMKVKKQMNHVLLWC